VGYIDVDTHVRETEETWSYLRPHEEQYRPLLAEIAGGSKVPVQFWLIQDQRTSKIDGLAPTYTEEDRTQHPPGTKGLHDIPARLRAMDELGVDVQILFPTAWINTDVQDPVIDAALKRSCNRWLAERTKLSGGRLRWLVNTPTGDMNAALEELEFGADNGAVGLFLLGEVNGLHVGHPALFPLYQKAEELGLVVSYHIGLRRVDHLGRYPGPQLGWELTAPLTYAFHSVLTNKLPNRFPGLRWGFFEGGSGWVPWMIQEAQRQDEVSVSRGTGDWRDDSNTVLERNNMYVACQDDDDLPYLVSRLGEDNLVIGSDWGHYDMGTDPAAQRVLSRRTDVDPATVRKIVDTNARRLFDIDPSFTPSDTYVKIT
jgi:predicted TIM-barrel fold metal-dependent hydrolase